MGILSILLKDQTDKASDFYAREAFAGVLIANRTELPAVPTGVALFPRRSLWRRWRVRNDQDTMLTLTAFDGLDVGTADPGSSLMPKPKSKSR